MNLKRALPALLLLPGLAACAPAPQAQAVASTDDTQPVRTRITDLDSFNAYIATHPTPEALRAQYPGLFVVMPGDLTTRELRGDNSRYFVELDAQGRVVGGRFQ